ncbi:hypothetical protein [Crocosphaera sp.]|uniref:hypothetical protein n=1 Tax=Crocosphaera sp. TaxID=2729996 RepID=UPI002613D8E9|nr:hypothetical protein [Crocosphaera sp.]MDJ0578675.1 hypothetical protein [Crocosphaera sp.]
MLLLSAPMGITLANPSTAEITYRGVFDCFEQSLSYPKDGSKPVFCEPSAIIQAGNQLYIAIDRLVRTHKLYFKGTGNREQGTEKCPNSFGDCYIASDKDIPGASSVMTAELDGNILNRTGYVEVPKVKQQSKAEDFALEQGKGNRVFLTSGFDRVFLDDASKDSYNTLLTWEVGKEEKAQVMEPTGFPASSLSLRPRFLRALTTEKFPSGAPYWKVEGLAMIPKGKMLFGIRELGTNFKDFDYTLELVASEWKGKNHQHLGNFKRVYKYDPQTHPQIDFPVGLSSVAWDKYHQQLLITTSYELGDRDTDIGAYLWTLSLDDLEAQKPPTLVTKSNGEPLLFAHKTEGIIALSATKLLAIHDDDRVVGDSQIDYPEREFFRERYQGAYSLVEWR